MPPLLARFLPLLPRLRAAGVLGPMFAAIAACWVAEEFYPLSSFPMYSKFDDRTYLVYLKDAGGEPLPTVGAVNMVSSQLKKRYGDELEALKRDHKGSHFDWTAEQKRPAGEATLRYLRDIHTPRAFADGRLDGLRLVDVRVYLEDNKPVTAEEEIAVLPAE